MNTDVKIKVDRLNQCPKIEQDKMLYMWIKQDVISLSEYREILKSLTTSSRIIDRLNREVKKRDAIIIQGHTEDEKSWKAHDRLVREKESILMTKRILEKDDL